MKKYYPICLAVSFCCSLTQGLLFAQNTITVTAGTSDNGLPAHTFVWTDATNNTRSATLVDQRPGGAGYLRRFVYKVNGTDRVCRGTGANGHQGDGYLQNHTVYGGDASSHGVAGTTTLPLQGRHHCIIDFYMPNYTITSPGGSGGTNATVPSRVQWFFATGRNYPIFSMVQDARAVTAGNIGADSRSPYGDFHYDGNTNSGAYSGDLIGGASWGDNYKWVSVANGTTNESTQINTNSGWRYNEPNTIPYAMQWTKNVNAEMGHVSTQPMSVKDMGLNGYPYLTPNTQQLNGPLIGDDQWCYQILAYGILDANGGVTKRLTWGTNWGYPGGFDEWGSYPSKTDFTRHGNGSRTNGMLLAYSVWEVLGTHTGGYKAGSVGKMVSQMENMQLATLSAATGAVTLSGPAGAGLSNIAANNVTYTPAGYNHIFATWEASASANIADITLTPAASKPIETPVFVLNNYTATSISSICIGNASAVADVDYFATIDAAGQKLWITVNRTISTPLRVQINTNACILLPLQIAAFTAQQRNGQVMLDWHTGTGSGCRQFVIERSSNGVGFLELDSIACSINRSGHYTFTDKKPLTGTNYYRLKQVEHDGHFSYSKTVQADFEGSILKIFSLIEKNTFLVSFNGLPQGSIRVIDALGKVVQQYPIQRQQKIRLDGLPAGNYYLNVTTAAFSQAKKVLVL